MKRVEPRNYVNEYQKLSGEKICPPVFAQICHKFCRLAGSPQVLLCSFSAHPATTENAAHRSSKVSET
jgi:hypothetical protein